MLHLACVVILTPLLAAESAATLATHLAKLRAEVEALSQSVADERAREQQALASFSARKTDLQIEVQRESLRLEHLRKLQAERQADIKSSAPLDAEIKPGVLTAIAEMMTSVEIGLPFRRDERKAELEKLRTQLHDGVISAAQAAVRLWSHIEDEQRLSQQNGIYDQVLRIDGIETLCEVAKLGMVTMFFRSKDTRQIGRTYFDGTQWTHEVLHDKRSRNNVVALFDALKKHIHSGPFTLPIAAGSDPAYQSALDAAPPQKTLAAQSQSIGAAK